MIHVLREVWGSSQSIASSEDCWQNANMVSGKGITINICFPLEAMFFPVVVYGCEKLKNSGLISWIQLDWFPLDLKIKQSVLKEISPEYSLDGMMLKLKLQHFGHLIKRADSFQETLMLGKIEGKRISGWQRMRWLDSITDSMDINLSKLHETVEPVMQQSTESQRVGHNLATEQQLPMICYFPGGSVVKNLPANAGHSGNTCSIPGSGKPPWRSSWQPTSIFLPRKSHGLRRLGATVHRFAKSQTQLSEWTISQMWVKSSDVMLSSVLWALKDWNLIMRILAATKWKIRWVADAGRWEKNPVRDT